MFGLNTLLAAFPDARSVALAEVMPAIQSQVTPDYLAFWGGLFPGQIPEQPVLPEVLDGNVIDLEGHELRLISVGQSDTAPSAVVHVPDLNAVVGGDACYNRIHVWLALTNHDARLAWIDTLGKIEALAPRIVVAGHKAPGAPDDDLAELIAGTRQYIIDFDEAERVARRGRNWSGRCWPPTATAATFTACGPQPLRPSVRDETAVHDCSAPGQDSARIVPPGKRSPQWQSPS